MNTLRATGPAGHIPDSSLNYLCKTLWNRHFFLFFFAVNKKYLIFVPGHGKNKSRYKQRKKDEKQYIIHTENRKKQRNINYFYAF
jgi:hypothetical protein